MMSVSLVKKNKKDIKVFKKTVRPILNITWPPFISKLAGVTLKSQLVDYKLLPNELSY